VGKGTRKKKERAFLEDSEEFLKDIWLKALRRARTAGRRAARKEGFEDCQSLACANGPKRRKREKGRGSINTRKVEMGGGGQGGRRTGLELGACKQKHPEKRGEIAVVRAVVRTAPARTLELISH